MIEFRLFLLSIVHHFLLRVRITSPTHLLCSSCALSCRFEREQPKHTPCKQTQFTLSNMFLPRRLPSGYRKRADCTRTLCATHIATTKRAPYSRTESLNWSTVRSLCEFLPEAARTILERTISSCGFFINSTTVRTASKFARLYVSAWRF